MPVLTTIIAAATAPAGPNWASRLTAWSTFGGACIAGLALLGAIYQIRRNRASERETRAHSYIARYNEADQIPYVVRMNKFMSLRRASAASRIKRWEKMGYRQRLLTVHYMNFWEELAGMYNRDLVDRPLVRDYFGSAALALWERSRWFTDYQRGGSNDRIMLELQQMCADIKRHREADARPTSGRIPPDQAALPELIRRRRLRRAERRRQEAEAIT